MTDIPHSPDSPDQTSPTGGKASFDYAGELERAQHHDTVAEDLGNEALDLLFKDVAYEHSLYNDFARPKPPSFSTNAEVTETALRYLAGKPVGYDEPEPYADEADKGHKFQLALGGQAVAGIRFYTKGHTAEIDYIGVHHRLERHGLGRRLMHSAVAYMKDHGITDLNSRNLSRDGFMNRLAIFGPDKLHFYYDDEHRQSGLTGPPPANADEARAALERAYQGVDPANLERGDAPPTFGVHVDLREVDAADWERPVPAEVQEKRVIYQPESV